jgi:cyclase
MSTAHSDHEPLAPPRVEDLGGGLYAYIQPDGSWFINNTGFLVSRTGVVCIDGCATERRTRALLESVSDVTALPVRTLLNTHSHADHVTGNALFASATIVAHEGTRSTMLESPPLPSGVWEPFETGSLPVTPPFLTYRDGLTVWVDDLRCELRHVEMPAHTTNDSYLWIPSRKVLYSGDLVFNGGTPFCLSGSVTRTIRVLTEQIVPLDPELIVPGHGNLCGPEVFAPTLAYLRLVEQVARAGIAAGVGPLEAARETDLGQFAEWTDSERIVGNLHRAYADIRGTALTPIETLAALRDMVVYNGGRPLTCLA